MSESNWVGKSEKYGVQLDVRRYSYIIDRMRGVQPDKDAKSSAGRREGSAEVEVVRSTERGMEKSRVSGCSEGGLVSVSRDCTSARSRPVCGKRPSTSPESGARKTRLDVLEGDAAPTHALEMLERYRRMHRPALLLEPGEKCGFISWRARHRPGTGVEAD